MQRNIKPNIDDFAKRFLCNNILENVLGFSDFLRVNDLAAKKASKYFWYVKHEGIRIATISIRENSWWIRYFGRTDGSHELLDSCEKYMTEDLKDLILNNINEPHCKNCNSFVSKIIWGKMFDRVCWCTPFCLRNPDGKALDYAKEIILICEKAATDIAKSRL